MNRLRELRKKQNLSLMKMAKQIGISSTRLWQYETGKRIPNKNTLQTLANFFDVSTNDLKLDFDQD
ncbi:helix-turn-helix domain-containing protein [Lactobacillus johnsonii]|uniref:Helix-turn-helix transcriptional regulator n=1 Tax=Lactobacillus johnsonii TaxID=33959 RepID=A0A9X7TJT7_LACJH|nr:helix-turn-helix transcriptional regulator [Lactobacillus johnsonii]QIA88673.1 helix-turn-helix transcriptional regulator [Lactobacillus johnsonii]